MAEMRASQQALAVGHGRSRPSTTPIERPATTADRCRALAAQLEAVDPTKATNYRRFADALDRRDIPAIRHIAESINHNGNDS